MGLFTLIHLLLGATAVFKFVNSIPGHGNEYRVGWDDQEALGSGIDGQRYRTACPDYKHYAIIPQYARHGPLRLGMSHLLICVQVDR